MSEHYRKTKHGALVHVRSDTQPHQSHGMIEETWKLGPFHAEHHYVRGDRRYGSWLFGLMLFTQRWRGPWFNLAFGSGAQDWDIEDE